MQSDLKKRKSMPLRHATALAMTGQTAVANNLRTSKLDNRYVRLRAFIRSDQAELATVFVKNWLVDSQVRATIGKREKNF